MTEELLKKISSYSIFNFLLPGTLFVFLADQLTSYSLIQGNLLIALFLYYFIGLTISRIGSLVVEPVFNCLKITKPAPYDEYVKASQADSGLEVLLEQNNVYRTLVALFLSLTVLLGYEQLESACPILNEYLAEIVLGLFLLLFSLSFRKQTGYVASRVKTINSIGNSEDRND